MASRQLLFKTLYRLGFVPWDGHPLPKSLKDLVEGDDALPAGEAHSTSAAEPATTPSTWQKHGWKVTGVDYVGERR